MQTEMKRKAMYIRQNIQNYISQQGTKRALHRAKGIHLTSGYYSFVNICVSGTGPPKYIEPMLQT